MILKLLQQYQNPIVDPMGQYNHPGKVTIIPGTKEGTPITMKGINYPILGIDNLGNKKLMKPGKEYFFPGSEVTEIPLAQNGTKVPYYQELSTETAIDQMPYGVGSAYMAAKAWDEGKFITTLSELLKVPGGAKADAIVNFIQKNPYNIDINTFEKEILPTMRLTIGKNSGISTSIGQQIMRSKVYNSDLFNPIYNLPTVLEAANKLGISQDKFVTFIENNWGKVKGNYLELLKLADKAFNEGSIFPPALKNTPGIDDSPNFQYGGEIPLAQSGYQVPNENIIDRSNDFIFDTRTDQYLPLRRPEGVVLTPASERYNQLSKDSYGIGQCTAGACYASEDVMKKLNLPGLYQLREKYKITSGEGHPRQKEYGVSPDAWDMFGLFADAGGDVVWKAKNYLDIDKLTSEEFDKMVRKLPLGTIINYGNKDTKYDTSNSYNEKMGMLPGNHFASIVGYDETGYPVTYDFGRYKRLGRESYGKLINIVVPKEYKNLTFDYLKSAGKAGGSFEYTPMVDYTPLIENLSTINPKADKEKMARFLGTLSDNKLNLLKDLNNISSSEEYDKLALLAASIAFAETDGGYKWTIGNLADAAGEGKSTGLTQINEDTFFKKDDKGKYVDPELAKLAHKYKIYSKESFKDPEFAALATMIYLNTVKPRAQAAYQKGKASGERYFYTPDQSIRSTLRGLNDIFIEPLNKNISLPRSQSDINQLNSLFKQNKIPYIAGKNDKGYYIKKQTTGNAPLSFEEIVGYYWNSPNTLTTGDAEGKSEYVKKIINYYSTINKTLGKNTGGLPDFQYGGYPGMIKKLNKFSLPQNPAPQYNRFRVKPMTFGFSPVPNVNVYNAGLRAGLDVVNTPKTTFTLFGNASVPAITTPVSTQLGQPSFFTGARLVRKFKEGGIVSMLKKYQNSGQVQPIYVSDPNDPRLKAYQDSLYWHNVGEEDYKIFLSLKNKVDDAIKNKKTLSRYIITNRNPIDAGHDSNLVNRVNTGNYLEHTNFSNKPNLSQEHKKIEFINPSIEEKYSIIDFLLRRKPSYSAITFIGDQLYQRYKKPTTPIIYRPQNKSQLSTNQINRPAVVQPIRTKEKIKTLTPIETKVQNSSPLRVELRPAQPLNAEERNYTIALPNNPMSKPPTLMRFRTREEMENAIADFKNARVYPASQTQGNNYGSARYTVPLEYIMSELEKKEYGGYAGDGLTVKVKMPNGKLVDINTNSPEYRELYKKGQIHSYDKERDEYIAPPLDEVEVVAQAPKSWKDFASRFSGSFDGSSPLSALSTVVTTPLSFPQAAATYWLSGDKSLTPSQALKIQNPIGAFAVDAVADPTNLIGVGLVDDAFKLSNKAGNFLTTRTPLKKTYKVNPFAVKEIHKRNIEVPGDEGYIIDLRNRKLYENKMNWLKGFKPIKYSDNLDFELAMNQTLNKYLNQSFSNVPNIELKPPLEIDLDELHKTKKFLDNLGTNWAFYYNDLGDINHVKALNKKGRTGDYSLPDEELKKIRQYDNLWTESINKKLESLNLPIGKKLGAGGEGVVYEFRDFPEYTIKLANPFTSSSDLFHKTKVFRDRDNIAVPLRLSEKSNSRSYTGKDVVSIMRNLKYPGINHNLSRKEVLERLEKDIREIYDQGLTVDVDNYQNFEYDPQKKIINLYDIGERKLDNNDDAEKVIKKLNTILRAYIPYKNGGLIRYQNSGKIYDRKSEDEGYNITQREMAAVIPRIINFVDNTEHLIAKAIPKNLDEDSRQKLFEMYRPIAYPSFATGAEETLKYLVGNTAPPVKDAEGNYESFEEAWRLALGLPIDHKYVQPSKYRPLNEKDKSSKYYKLNHDIIDVDYLKEYVKGIDLKPGQHVLLDTFSPFIKDTYMNADEFSSVDPIQQFKLGVNNDGQIYIYDKYDFDFEPLQKIIQPYQYEFYDEFGDWADKNSDEYKKWQHSKTKTTQVSPGLYTDPHFKNGGKLKKKKKSSILDMLNKYK